ncbi:MAG: AEC family transporter [Armatimonadetes bacterium]|nr:AEC family transporter [Armatimonadota bacterium]
MSATGTVLSIFLLLSVGYGAKKVKLLRDQDADLLNTVVVYITLPAFIFDAIYSYRQPIPLSIAKVPIIGFAMILVVLGIAYVVGRAMGLDRPTLGGMIIASGFGNTGFLGYPLVQAAFREKAALVTAALYDELAMALPLYTLGALIAAGFAGRRVDREQLLRVFTLPSMLSIPIALIIRPISLPNPLLEAVRYLAAGTVPLVMISLGLSLSGRSLRGLALPVAVTCVLKLVALPVITYYAARSGGLSGVMHQVTVVEAGMPSAIMTCVIASKFGANARFVAGVIFLTTLLSIASIPLMLYLLNVR